MLEEKIADFGDIVGVELTKMIIDKGKSVKLEIDKLSKRCKELEIKSEGLDKLKAEEKNLLKKKNN